MSTKTKKQLEANIKKREHDLDYRKTFTTIVIAAMSFVAGLFWRDAIQAALELFPKGSGILGNTLTAAVITALFAIFIVRVNQKTKKMEQGLDRARERLEKKKK